MLKFLFKKAYLIFLDIRLRIFLDSQIYLSFSVKKEKIKLKNS